MGYPYGGANPYGEAVQQLRRFYSGGGQPAAGSGLSLGVRPPSTRPPGVTRPGESASGTGHALGGIISPPSGGGGQALGGLITKPGGDATGSKSEGWGYGGAGQGREVYKGGSDWSNGGANTGAGDTGVGGFTGGGVAGYTDPNARYREEFNKAYPQYGGGYILGFGANNGAGDSSREGYLNRQKEVQDAYSAWLKSKGYTLTDTSGGVMY